MKKLLVSLTVALVCVSAFGQGKLAFGNNSNQLIYMTDGTILDHILAPADVGKNVGGFSLAGSSLYTGAGGTVASLAGVPGLTVALFGGTTAGSMSQLTTGTLGDVNFAGLINPPANVTFASLPAGTPAFFQIQVFDTRYASAAAAWNVPYIYAGESSVFQATPQTSVYSPIYSATANSTLPVGTYIPKDYAAYPGYAGLIEVYATVPEPGTFALAGLGLASLMIFRRRK
jgi:hypothetical protein